MEFDFISGKSVFVLSNIVFQSIDIDLFFTVEEEIFDIVSIIFFSAWINLLVIFEKTDVEKSALSYLIITILQALVHKKQNTLFKIRNFVSERS